MMFTQVQGFDRPGRYVGRVGALAVALGVGGAVLGFAGVAAADGDAPDTTAGGTTSTGEPVRAAATRAGDGRGAPTVRVGPAASTSVADATTGRAIPDRRPGNPRATAATRSSQGRDATQPSVVAHQPDPVDLDTRVLPAVPTAVGPYASGSSASAAIASQPIAVAAVEASPAVATAAAAPEVAPAVASAAAAGDPLTLLGGGGGGAPLLAPLAWATLAAARREELGGATPEVAPADVVGTGELDAAIPCAAACVSGLSTNKAAVGKTITLTGNYLSGIKTVKFGCKSSSCDWGVVATPKSVSNTQVTVEVPVGAPSGYIQAIGTGTGGRPVSPISSQSFTVDGVLPTISDFTQKTGSIGGGPPVTITGTNFTGAAFVQFGEGQTTSFTVLNGGTSIEVAVPDNATTGPIVVGLPTGGAVSSATFTVDTAKLPDKSTCTDGGGGYCDLVGLDAIRVLGINALSAAIGQALPSTGPVGTCTANGCPIPFGQTTPSVANTIGIYAYNVIYSLSGKNTKVEAIGKTVVDLVTQPNVLTFISQTVAGNAALAALPPAVATTIGNAVSTFVQNSLGNTTVANALVPFLQALNLPTALDLPFVALLQTDPKQALLSRFTSDQWSIAQADLQNKFFGNSDVQTQLGTAFTAAANVLLGSSAVAGYLGQVAASALVGQPVDASNPLAVTIGGAVGTLFSSIGGTVATDAGTAFATLLAQPQLPSPPGPDVPPVATTLANVVVNTVVGALGVGILPYQVQLIPALAPAADVAVTGFVNSVLAPTSGVVPALGTFVTEVTTGVLSDQQLVSTAVANQVSALLKGTPLAQAVGTQVGTAAAVLLGDPDVSAAVATLVNSVVGGILNADGVVPALADAAGGVTAAVMTGTSFSDALNDAATTLGQNPDVDAAVGPAVTAAVATFLGTTGLQSAVDAAASSLVTGLIGDTTVQTALRAEVTSAVSTLLGGGALGQAVGTEVGDAVVTLITDPNVSGALVELVDTVFSDFISSQGVITALSNAAGELATAAVEGTLDTELPKVQSELRSNADIDAALQASVGAAVTQFLKDTGVLSAVDTALSSLVTDVIADPTVLDAVGDRVASEVNSFLGFGPISVVGDDVGAAVVALLANPIVSGALVELVDTVFSDFFGANGVADAFGAAAGDVALGVLTGESLDAALVAAGKDLRANTDVDDAVQASVGAAVAQFLGDTQLWSTVDAGVTALLTELITDPVVQSVLTDRVADEVSAQLGGGDLGQVVGDQVAATVLGLLTDPVIGGALLGVVDTTFSDLFGSTGVIDAFSTAAGDLALAALTLRGSDFDEARAGIIAGLRNNPDVDAGVQFAVGEAVAGFLNNTYVWSSVDAAAASLLGELLGDSVVQQALTDRIANEVNSRLGFGPISVVGDQVGAFVVGLLTDPIVSDALVDIVDTVFTDFIYSDGVVDALSGAAGDVALAVLTGESFSAATQDALSALKANADIDAAVRTTVSDALGVINTQVLSNPTFQEDLGTGVTTLINDVAADQPVQALVTERYGAAIGGLLADTAVVNDVATAVGSAITQLLGYTGVSTAVTDAADQFILAVLDGTDAGEAGQEAVKSLQSDPSFVAGVNAVIPPILNGLLDTAEVRQAVGVVVQQVTLARLEGMRFNIPFFDRIIAQVAKGTVEDFLTRKAGQKLIDTLAVDLLLGLPASDVSEVVVRDIVRDPVLQIALGFSVGAGIGSLFGDNIIGDVIGWVTGFPATVVVGVGAAVIGFYQWIVGLWTSVIDAFAAPAQAVEVPSWQARIA